MRCPTLSSEFVAHEGRILEVAQSTVSKYMVRSGTPSSQNWTTFHQNHAQVIAAIDICVVPTLTFELLSCCCGSR